VNKVFLGQKITTICGRRKLKLWKKMTTEDKLRTEFTILAIALMEKRSDIADIIETILDGGNCDPSRIEHRFITGNFNGVDIEPF
jgi:hypothetical protein